MALSMSVIEEPSKTGIMREIIEKKIRKDFLVTKNPVTKRGSTSFSKYCRSQHDICSQHKMNHFKKGTVKAGVIVPSSLVETNDVEVEKGWVITSIIEFKTGIFARHQILAQMMCTLTDCCVEVLKKGEQISQSIIYGLSVDYSKMKATIYNMVMDFNAPPSKSFGVIMLQDLVPLEQGLNCLVSFIGNYFI